MPDLTYTAKAQYERELAKFISERDKMRELPDGTRARIVEEVYWPASYCAGGRAQIVQYVEPIK